MEVNGKNLFLFFYTHFIFYGYISRMRYIFFCAITTMSVIFGYHRSNFQVAKNGASSLHKEDDALLSDPDTSTRLIQTNEGLFIEQLKKNI